MRRRPFVFDNLRAAATLSDPPLLAFRIQADSEAIMRKFLAGCYGRGREKLETTMGVIGGGRQAILIISKGAGSRSRCGSRSIKISIARESSSHRTLSSPKYPKDPFALARSKHSMKMGSLTSFQSAPAMVNRRLSSTSSLYIARSIGTAAISFSAETPSMMCVYLSLRLRLTISRANSRSSVVRS